jgi:hypothetical protein
MLAFGVAKGFHDNDMSHLTAREVVQNPAGLDNSSLGLTIMGWLAGPRKLRTVTTLDAAVWLSGHQDEIPAEWKDEPIWNPVIAMAKQGEAYDGHAHVTAAEILYENGCPVKAYTTLNSAAYWYGKNQRGNVEQIRKRILKLAKNNGWNNLEHALLWRAPGNLEQTNAG